MVALSKELDSVGVWFYKERAPMACKMNPHSLPFTVYPSKSKIFLLLLVLGAFVAVGILMIRYGQMMGWLVAGFFGLGCLVFLIQLLPKSSYLTVSEDGIEFCSLFGKSKLQWSDISEFGVSSIRNHGLSVKKMVGINFSPTYTRASKGRKISKALSGFEGALPDTYGFKAEELAQLLSMYHSKKL